MTYEWAYLTMKVHQLDHKEYLYSLADYINFNTHDIYFNAAMKEMVHLGKMHGYMRMYWCKKICVIFLVFIPIMIVLILFLYFLINLLSSIYSLSFKILFK